MSCIFCQKPLKPIYENELVYVMYDGYPVTKGHTLIITKRHAQTYFDLTHDEKLAIDDAIMTIKKRLDERLHPDGYNIGINNNKAAGQTIFHLHVHLIPRYLEDTPNPKGGVRGVIPDKQGY
jgi:diadenosine tetraphosphate (Ap4A) HIT family hydrolase